MTTLQRTRMIVRLASLGLSLFFLYHVLRDTLAGQLHSMNTPFTLAFVAVTLACIVAWRWERLGGTALIVTGLALGLAASLTIATAATAAGLSMPVQIVAGLVWALPYIIFGLLFRAVAQRESRLAYGSI